MPARRYINALAIVFASVVLLSFAVGSFMLVQRSRPSRVLGDISGLPATGADTRTLLTAAEDHLEQGETEQALIAYRQVIAGDPRSVAAQMGLARSELRAGREEIAQREFERVLELAPANDAALLEIARIQSHRPDGWLAAERSYRVYLKRKPGDSDGWLSLARVVAWQKKWVEAADLFGRADVARRMTDKDHRDFASALVRSGRLTEAEALLKKLIAKDPRDFDLRLQLAGIYSSRQDWSAALPLFESMLGERPDDFRLNLTYGLGLLSMKQYRQALGPLGRARNLAPSDGEAGLGLARALKGSGDLRAADREFERVLPQYTGSPATQREYADLLLERKEYRKSERYYKDAYRLGLRDDPLLLGLAGALSGTSKFKEAIPYLEEVYRRRPTDRVAFELAKLYQKLGRNDRALSLISQIDTR